MDLIVFSHLRWNFVYQRPQHIISRFTDQYRVFYIEEPELTENEDDYRIKLYSNTIVVTPQLNRHKEEDHAERQRELVLRLFREYNIEQYIFWYYAPMAFLFTNDFTPEAVVYDCMDELSAFKFAPPQLRQAEQDLLERADVVFTGGNSLYEAKKQKHSNIYCFPSSIDKTHFYKARLMQTDPADQQAIPHPRFGFFGVIDERFDTELVREVATQRPAWQFILLGPVVKIDEAVLPKLPNIYYLGMKSYDELPMYINSWDIAIMPFAINESTEFISPTKTPEYLAAGKPVISTRINDVVNPYGEKGLVHIIDNADEFIEKAIAEFNNQQQQAWLNEVDEHLADMSWDNTWAAMNSQVQKILDKKKKETHYV